MVLTDEGKKAQRMIASNGGVKAHANGNAHQWTSEEAKEAGRKGGRPKTATL